MMFGKNRIGWIDFPSIEYLPSIGIRLYQGSSYVALMAISISVIFYTFASSKAIAAEDIAFQVPSGNIHCRADDVNLNCELRTNNAKLPPKPKGCNLEWGNRFGMSQNGRAQRGCHGDTLIDSTYSILSYGQTWRRQGFTCVSQPNGLTCKNQHGHGWTLSKNKQQIF
jgi:hypothetical protein